MAMVKQIFGSNSRFSQIAMFSVSGLSMSMALVFHYNLQIAAMWL